MNVRQIRILLMLIAIFTAVAFILFILKNPLKEDKRKYSSMEFSSVYVTLTKNNTRSYITLHDTSFINSFTRAIDLCESIPPDKFKSDAIYTFKFFGKEEVTIDLLVVNGGPIVVRNLNYLLQKDKSFDGNSMREYVDKVNKMKLKRLF